MLGYGLVGTIVANCRSSVDFLFRAPSMNPKLWERVKGDPYSLIIHRDRGLPNNGRKQLSITLTTGLLVHLRI
jgi:hypothetical protein